MNKLKSHKRENDFEDVNNNNTNIQCGKLSYTVFG